MRDEGALTPAAARLFRMAVDTAILAVAFASGVAVDYAWRVDVRNQVVPAFSTYLTQVLPTLPLLVLTGLVVFSVSGFYTRRRFYRTRFKALAVLQGTALTYVLFTAEAYALRAYLTFPTAVAIAAAGLFSLGISLLVRVYSHMFVAWLGTPDAQPVKPHRRDGQRTVLVIGGAGYIGSALLPMLVTSGYRVRILDSLLYGRQPIENHLNVQRVELVHGDFRRIDQLVTAMKDVDEVIHLGGLVGDPACAVDEDLTIEINLTATRAVAEVAKAHGIRRFIFASTCSVYGASDETLDERSILNPVSLYAKSKVASERELLDLSDDTFRPTVLRFGTVYGLSGRTRFDLVVNLLTAKAAVDGVITVFGPDQWRPFVHVADVAKAVRCALQAPLEVAGGKVYNVGSNAQNVTLGQLGQFVKDQVPTADLLLGDGDGDRRNYRVNFDRITEELKFTPEWTLQEGIEQVLESLKSSGVTGYGADEFSNVKVIQDLVAQEGVAADRQRHLRLLEANIGFEAASPAETRVAR